MQYSVVIPTYNRPDCIKRNLLTLQKLRPLPVDVAIVDASTDTRTQTVIEDFVSGNQVQPFKIAYIKNPAGRGNTPNSRNQGVAATSGEIIAFLDDDAFPHTNWANALLQSYIDYPQAAGVAGRALNGIAGESSIGLSSIGKFTNNGILTGNFAADPGAIVSVDHGIGCNMSLRRKLLQELGGFADDIRPGPFGLCEETEIFIRAKKQGHHFIFNPEMSADHIAAPQPNSKRFGISYSYYHARNNMLMVSRNYGISLLSTRHFVVVAVNGGREWLKRTLAAQARLCVTLAGLVVGLIYGLAAGRFQGPNSKF